MASLREHTGPVNKLVVAQDNTFFASASSDGSCKVIHLCLPIYADTCIQIGADSCMHTQSSSESKCHMYIYAKFCRFGNFVV